MFMISFAGAAFVMIICQPLGSQNILGIQEFSSTGDYLLSQGIEDHGLSILATVGDGNYDSKSILGALQVLAYSESHDIGISCTASPLRTLQTETENGIIFLCPDVNNPYVLIGADFEVLITVNFTRLSPAHSSAPTSHNLELKNAVQIAVGMGEPFEAALQYLSFFLLWPDLHLRGALSFSTMFVVNNTGLSKFGITKYRQIAVGSIGPVFPNLTPSVVGTNISSLRLFSPRNLSYLRRQYSKEVQQHSVLGGFSVLGGLWTAFSGVFAMIFGTSILLVVFGIKPLSIYGLIHAFTRGQVSLADGQALSSVEQSRTIALLREHLMDIDGAEVNGAEGQDGAREADGGHHSLIPERRTDDVEMCLRH
ncbi:hypothetical protein P691DRAFT_764326 [Macrolepiota fuliginosa MF-IS2]|uniref:Uncharacterized protein n=1 Tax=Macrolepiota fuliginosa MF-IS2 TaxID=1400762 RepID=A0A9P6BZF7_9AGAR|nr:hypothetical protein P691DRAFT_764326 [Macrolepiota fuliginosa MF-IS2]